MDNEHRPLLARNQNQSILRCSWPLILIFAILTEVLLISFFQYSANNHTSRSISLPQGHRKKCSSKHFKSHTLKLIRQVPFADIFGVDDINKFEISDIIADSSGDALYCVLDDSFLVARIGHTLRNFLSDDARVKNDDLLRWKGDHPKGDSGFEFITFNASSRTYIIGTEATEMDDGSLRSQLFDVTFDGDHTIVHGSCVSEFMFSHPNKGFEGAVIVEVGGRSFLLGLCEGNFCRGGRHGRMSGNGRLVVMEREEGSTCIYKTVGILKLPKEVDFQDYSAITIWDGSRIGIASQENAAIFVGDVDIKQEMFKITNGRIYDLPRNDDCEVKYCNLEGLYFLRHNLVVTVTDSMKNKAKQHYRCREMDESIQVFQIPTS